MAKPLARQCEKCGGKLGCFSFRYHNGKAWQRGYFHPQCFQAFKTSPKH